MRFAVSTHLYHDRPLGPDSLGEIAAYGFREIELFATIGHFDYHDEAAIARLDGWLRDAGLALHSVHAPIVEHLRDGRWGPALSTAATNETDRRRAVGEAVLALGIARRVPYRYLVVHLGVPDALSMPAGSNDRDAAARSLQEIVAAAWPLGVQVAVEVIPNELSRAESVVRLLEEELELPAPGAGICLDVGHAFIQGDLIDAIELVSGELVTTHVHDNRGTDDEHLVPFEGAIDWPATLMSLQKVGYEGAIVLELANTSTPRRVLEQTVGMRGRFEAIVHD